MLEKLFGSRTRVKLLRLFLTNVDRAFFVREIAREIDEQINSVRRELNNLEKIGLLTSVTQEKKKFYRVNTQYLLFEELRSLIVKSRLTLEKKFFDSIQQVGSIHYLALTGYFVNDDAAQIDMLVVGNVSRPKLNALLEQFKESFGEQLRYTVMKKDEYLYRLDVNDRFLYSIVNGSKIVLIDSEEQKNVFQQPNKEETKK